MRGSKTASQWIKIKKHKIVKRCVLCNKLIENPHQNKLYCDSCLAKLKAPRSQPRKEAKKVKAIA